MNAPRTSPAGGGGGRHGAAVRRCSRTACGRTAVATLTYVYSDSTAVLGPLAAYAEPHCYDLCSEHAERLTAPRGWEVVRLAPELVEAAARHDDLLAVADAVRDPADGPRAVVDPDAPAVRRGHLRVLREDHRR
ncbi:DUF3499 domain-containing protein [Paenibacillus sp. TRM 82003]|uniref:DUF3499 domain-containing protein n=1 Tax=Kineococcus sp. TRM81007 TaxID=2925831 RepID=UPI001F5ABA46|nr:DUF3499 domain-containing protein [Kineococcus sp. TRM81007]MCI2237871.1 DUF3499 domain-containing protein [Kineococcus sp. TRM81007]MCI3924602.1 DUF3499 domain-containing protein [Paenibacillus sp. TRM 82003]